MKYGKVIVCTFLAAIFVMLGLNMMMTLARRDAEARTNHIYVELLKGEARATIPGVTPEVFEQLQAQSATFGPVRSFRISDCITQITTLPSICSVYVSRERGNSVEKFYWYGDRCLRFVAEPDK